MPRKVWVCAHCEKSFKSYKEADKKYHEKLCPEIIELNFAIKQLQNTKSGCELKIAANLKALSLLELKAQLKIKTERINQTFEYAFRQAKHEAKKTKQEKSQFTRKRNTSSCTSTNNSSASRVNNTK